MWTLIRICLYIYILTELPDDTNTVLIVILTALLINIEGLWWYARIMNNIVAETNETLSIIISLLAPKE